MKCRSFAVCIGLLSVAFCRLAHAQEQISRQPNAQEGRISYDALRRDQIDSLFDSLRGGSLLSMPPTHSSQTVDANIAGIWAGASTIIEAEQGEIILRFRPTMEARLAQGEKSDSRTPLAEMFNVRVRMTNQGLVIVHELAQSKLERTGILAEINREKHSPTRTAYVAGARDSGIYFSVPPLTRGDAEKTWGMLMCPRVAKLAPKRRGDPLHLELLPSPYELSEIKVSYTARASASIPTSSYKHKLEMNVGVTSELPATIEPKDEVVSQAPSLRMLYRPNTPFDFFRFAPKASIQEGLLTRVEMQNQAGHIRTQYFGNVLFVHKIAEPSPISVVFEGKRAGKDEGYCYVVVADKPMWTEYDRRTPDF